MKENRRSVRQEASPPLPPAAASGALGSAPDRLQGLSRVGLLGLNAWLVGVLIPSMYIGAGEPIAIVLGALPLLALIAGLVAFEMRPDIAGLALMAGFPPLVALAVAARPELVESDAYGPIGIALAAASMLAFVASAAHASRPERPYPDARTQRLANKEPVVEPLMRRWLRRALLALASVGAFAIAVIAPALGSRRDRVAAWDDAADDASALTAVVASVVTAVAVGAVVGPALRASRAIRPLEKRTRRRWMAAIAIALASAVGWSMLRGFAVD